MVHLVQVTLGSDSLCNVSGLSLVDGKNVIERRDPTKGGQPSFSVEINYR